VCVCLRTCVCLFMCGSCARVYVRVCALRLCDIVFVFVLVH